MISLVILAILSATPIHGVVLILSRPKVLIVLSNIPVLTCQNVACPINFLHKFIFSRNSNVQYLANYTSDGKTNLTVAMLPKNGPRWYSFSFFGLPSKFCNFALSRQRATRSGSRPSHCVRATNLPYRAYYTPLIRPLYS
jgi:hypothetical protein